MSYVPILHLTVPAIWVSVLLAAVAASLLQRLVTREKTGDWYWNALVLYILTWKLSYILFNFEHFYHMPLSLLYFNGGLPGHLLGVLFASAYMMMAHRKHSDVASQAPIAVLLFFLTYQSLLHSFEQYTLGALAHLVLLVVSIVSLRIAEKREDVPRGLLLSLLFTFELLLTSLFGPLLTWRNATLIVLAAVTIFLYIRHEPKGRTL